MHISLTFDRLQRIAWYLFLIFIPFGTRTLVHQFTPGFHEYEALFLYASDVLILGIVSLITFCRECRFEVFTELTRSVYVPLTIFVGAACISIFLATSGGLAVASFLRLLLYSGLAVTVAYSAREPREFRRILAFLACLAVIQAAIGIWQFSAQAPVGLGFWGESPISPLDAGTSKIDLAGGKLIRAYGTFPHPNVYAAFLLMGLFSLYYLFLRSDKPLYGYFDLTKRLSQNFEIFMSNRHLYLRLLYAIGIFVVLLGLTFSLSRTAWAIALLFTPVFVFGASLRGARRAGRLLAVLVICVVGLYAVASPLISGRARVMSTEASVVDRIGYTKLGLETFIKHPFGVGIGNQVLASIRSDAYEAQGFIHPWQWEPIHNLYLLVAVETGLIGILSFLAFFCMVVWSVVRSGLSSQRVIALCLLFSLLAFGFFDHFLWTLQPGRLMLWLVVGLVLSQIQPRPSLSSFNG